MGVPICGIGVVCTEYSRFSAFSKFKNRRHRSPKARNFKMQHKLASQFSLVQALVKSVAFLSALAAGFRPFGMRIKNSLGAHSMLWDLPTIAGFAHSFALRIA